jgi:xanthine dehydrogenase accessory factor
MSFYQKVAEVEEKGESAAVCSVVRSTGSTPRHSGSKMLVFPDGSIFGTIGGGEIEHRVIDEALQVIKENTSKMLSYSLVDPQIGDPGVCGGQMEIFIEPIVPQPKLLVIGTGHVGKMVAHLAKWLGFEVAVSDDRAEFCNIDVVPEADEFYPCLMKDLPKSYRFTENTYIAITTRGSNVDVDGLPALIAQPFAYLGVIGSRRRWSVTRKTVIEKGIQEADLARIHSPIGLEINAETPKEIAISILAEIIMVRNGGNGKSMKA